MITKGIIREIIGNKFIVSVPALGQLEDNLNIDIDSLPIAQISLQPGNKPNYVIGDIVYVGIEDNNLFRPIILGLVSDKNSCTDMNAGQLNVQVEAILPFDTTVGKLHIGRLIDKLDATLIELTEICNNTMNGGNI